MPKSKVIILALCSLLLAVGGYLAKEMLLTPPANNPTTNPSAAQLQGKYDVAKSPYFPQLDVYNLVSNDHLTVLSHFKTRQQTTGYTCGPAAAMMVVEHFQGTCKDEEMAIAKIMGTNHFNGTSIKGMAQYFKSIGWQVKTSLDSPSPENPAQFRSFVLEALKNNTPIIVENIAWGGHYRVIIGYDTMGTAVANDDVLLLADSFDLGDHSQDGYNVEHASKFFYMWFDSKLFSRNEQAAPWVMAWPR